MKHAGKLGNAVSATRMYLNLLGNIFASRGANFFPHDNVSLFSYAKIPVILNRFYYSYEWCKASGSLKAWY